MQLNQKVKHQRSGLVGYVYGILPTGNIIIANPDGSGAIVAATRETLVKDGWKTI